MQTYIYKQIHKLQPDRPQDVCFFVYKFKKQDYECFTIPGLSNILSHHNKLSLLGVSMGLPSTIKAGIMLAWSLQYY
jgi:hypothetical protein